MMRNVMARLKLTVNESKTRSVDCRKRSSTFTGMRLVDSTRPRRGCPIGARLRPRNECSVFVRRSAK